jgi:hypothetical protein
MPVQHGKQESLLIREILIQRSYGCTRAPTHTSIALQKRVNGFELGMSEPGTDQQRECVVLVVEK